MIENAALFRIAGAMSAYAGSRQSVIAENIANADRPGYHAKGVTPFEATMERGLALKTSGAGHLNTGETAATFDTGAAVVLEQQMVEAVDAQRNHEKALAIYRHGLTVLRTALGRG